MRYGGISKSVSIFCSSLCVFHHRLSKQRVSIKDGVRVYHMIKISVEERGRFSAGPPLASPDREPCQPEPSMRRVNPSTLAIFIHFHVNMHVIHRLDLEQKSHLPSRAFKYTVFATIFSSSMGS